MRDSRASSAMLTVSHGPQISLASKSGTSRSLDRRLARIASFVVSGRLGSAISIATAAPRQLAGRITRESGAVRIRSNAALKSRISGVSGCVFERFGAATGGPYHGREYPVEQLRSGVNFIVMRPAWE